MNELSAPGSCDSKCADRSEFDLTMAFQPLIDIVERRIYGYEALVRGPNGESAASVMAQVNDDNLYAFDQACRVKAIESAAALGLDRRLNINFLPNAVYHPEACLKVTLAAARKCGFPAALITFEFSETQNITDSKHLKGIIEAYRGRGFMTALDDFGAGYAGLSLLADFQPDIIKIDRMLVSGIDADRPRQAIVKGLMATAEALGIQVVAEGVERAEELETLRALGISRYQGFLFARPAIGRLIPDDEIAWSILSG
jgi:EAL domain-containing protein (putative c-di-GMP-specific phosphodiesterase class I)